MIILLITASLLAAMLVGWLFYLGHLSQSGDAAGLVDGKLTRCPIKRNCVCSEYPNDNLHFVEPILLGDIPDESAKASVRKIVMHMGGVIHDEKEDYLAATFSSSLFSFVDDLELRFEPELKQIQIRSGSRVGDSDMGINRKRVEQFRALWLNTQKNGM